MVDHDGGQTEFGPFDTPADVSEMIYYLGRLYVRRVAERFATWPN